jgi:phosphoserine phosphatase RsbU/P
VTNSVDFEAFDREFADFSDRVTALRTVRENSPDIVDALILELELAEEELRVCRDELARQGQEVSEASGPANRERTLLRSAFTDLPVPVFILDHGGSIRRANRTAADLLGNSATYIAGKPFPVFVDLTARAAFRSRLSAVLRNGEKTSFTSVLTASQRRLKARLMLCRLDPPSEARPLVTVAVLPPQAPDIPAPASPVTAARGPKATLGAATGQPAGLARLAAPGEPAAVACDGDELAAGAAARHVDLISRVTRLLLDEESMSEPVTLHRVASQLQGEAADWVIVDLARDGGLARAVVAGPDESGPAARPRELKAGRPAGAVPLHDDVLETGKAVLHPVIPDENALGTTGDGRPLLTVLGAGSVLSVPLRAQCTTAGVLTLVRSPERPTFSLSDLRVFEEIGEHLALALRNERRYRRRSETAAALQASLLPRAAVEIPGLDWASVYRPGTRGVEVGGDFYDVFRSPGGWGVALGDVCGKGEEAAAVTAMVRHGIRMLSLEDEHPATVLAKVNTAMLTQQETDRFVTAVAGHLSWSEDGLEVELGSAGHPGAAVLRADGAVFFTAGGGAALGLFPDGEARTEQLSLAPGDTLLLYTDGVTEMRAADGTMYGPTRLAGVLTRSLGQPATAIVKAIEDDISAFGHGGPDQDDVALVAIRVEHVPG